MIYANDNDAKACEWMRELPLEIDHIDQRSITDVKPEDLEGYTQAHFFCGIAGWPYALELAGWPRDVPVWSGSCPCQPFSDAGKRNGSSDERHLWPEMLRLIAACRPPIIFGEQVAGRLGREWFGGVPSKAPTLFELNFGEEAGGNGMSGIRADLNDLGYVVGAADLPACSVGAPHIRQRLFWYAVLPGWEPPRLADSPLSTSERLGQQQQHVSGAGGDWGSGRLANGAGQGREGRELEPAGSECPAAERGGAAGRLGNTERLRAGRDSGSGVGAEEGASVRPVGDDAGPSGPVVGLGDAEREGPLPGPLRGVRGSEAGGGARDAELERPSDAGGVGDTESGGCGVEREAAQPRRIRHVNRSGSRGFWGTADYLYCQDNKWRPVKPGNEPLVDGLSARLADGTEISKEEMSRVTALRGLGNAIVPALAAEFIQAFVEAIGDCPA